MKKVLHVYLNDENTGEVIILRHKNTISFIGLIVMFARALGFMLQRHYPYKFSKIVFEDEMKYGKMG